MKKMMECILLDGFVAFEDIKDEFIEARDSFFDKEDRGKFEHTLRKMEEYYPLCYKLFANIFFEGKSVDELSSNSHARTVEPAGTSNVNTLPYYPDAKDDYVHRPYISGWLELLFIIVGTCCFPPILPIILITKYYDRHEKAVKRFLKKLLVIGVILLIIAIIGFGVWFVNDRKEKQYEDAHNRWLTDEEVEKSDKLAEKYYEKTNIDIMYISGDATEAAYEGAYIYLEHYGSDRLRSNCMSDDERERLADLLFAMIENENLSDMEVCEQFYEITYEFINENDITYERYMDAVELQQSYEHYELTEDGQYSVGFGSNDIKPGEYSVYGNVKSGSELYMYISGYVSGYKYAQVKKQTVIGAYRQNITVEEGDTIEIDYWGTGDYSIYMEAISQQSY